MIILAALAGAAVVGAFVGLYSEKRAWIGAAVGALAGAALYLIRGG